MIRIIGGSTFIAFGLILQVGCCIFGKIANSSSCIWKNPVIVFVNDPRIEPNQDQTKEREINFFEKMNGLFASSGLTRLEAQYVYERLFAGGFFRNEPTGLPSLEDDEIKETFEDFKHRVALRKTEHKSEYEFFLLKTGCGYSYIFGQIVMVEGADGLEIIHLESVHFSVPC